MLLNALISLQMLWMRLWPWRRFIQKTYHPKEVQERLLFSILRKNAETEFGKLHRFAGIGSYEEYRKRVAVQSYEDLRPFIVRQAETGVAALTMDPPIFYTQTSGTTSEPKLIPMTAQAIREYRASQRLFSYSLYTSERSIYSGKILGIVSPAVEGKLKNGVPYGSMSGSNYKDMPRIVRTKYVLSPEVFDIKDYDAKYKYIAKQALAEKNVTLLASANPSTFLKLLSVINSRSKKQRTFADLWPSLRAIVTWTGGSAGTVIPELKKLIPTHTKIIEMGYLSSEFRGTITLPHENNMGVPAFQDTFFEFVAVEGRDEGKEKFALLYELKPGKQYYVFITTAGGLYRYDMNDIIEVTGMFHNTPTIRFVQKGKGVTNITGEKLYESQVIQAVGHVSSAHDVSFPFFVMLADELASHYVLYVEHEPLVGVDLASEIETKLKEMNIEYAAKAHSGRLHPVAVNYLAPGTGEAYKQSKLRAGQRESQYKIMALQYKRDCDFNLHSYVVS